MTYKVHYIDEYHCLLSEKAFLKQKTAKTTHPFTMDYNVTSLKLNSTTSKTVTISACQCNNSYGAPHLGAPRIQLLYEMDSIVDP